MAAVQIASCTATGQFRQAAILFQSQLGAGALVMKRRHGPKRIRYAVVGLGHIAQGSVLPAFANASANSELAALISDDPKKLKKLSREYQVPLTANYREFNACLRSGEVDAVYIALPNSLHRDFAVQAAQAGVHVLCEKPLALNESECTDIIRACAENEVKLMTAYRLHFEHANLEAIKLLQEGRIGEPRIFNSTFTMQVKGGIRLDRKLGGGPLYDIGIYCINAARYLFRDEPLEVFAFNASSDDDRFREVDELVCALMRFPKDRLANFTASFGAADRAVYEVIGTKGILKMSQAYEYSEAMELELTVNGRTTRREYGLRDQFAPELIYFSDCILKDKEPEPSGLEGLLDVHIIHSVQESAKYGLPVKLKELRALRRPTISQEIFRPPPRRQVRVRAPVPHR